MQHTAIEVDETQGRLMATCKCGERHQAVESGVRRCDLCGGVPALVDGKVFGHSAWAFMCGDCFDRHGVGFGTGLGQMLIVR